MKIEITKAQLKAIINLKEDARAMVGSADAESDKLWIKYIKLIERMLGKNSEVIGIHKDTK